MIFYIMFFVINNSNLFHYERNIDPSILFIIFSFGQLWNLMKVEKWKNYHDFLPIQDVWICINMNACVIDLAMRWTKFVTIHYAITGRDNKRKSDGSKRALKFVDLKVCLKIQRYSKSHNEWKFLFSCIKWLPF